MNRFISIKTLMLTLTLLVASMPIAAIERPFSASGQGVGTFIIDSNGQIAGAHVVGSGNATHLGLFTNSGDVFFTPDPNNPILLRASGQGVITAANGDKLNIVIEEGATQNIVTGIGSGKIAFAGGTGRFANATGSTDFVVQNNLATGAYELTMVGKIDY